MENILDPRSADSLSSWAPTLSPLGHGWALSWSWLWTIHLMIYNNHHFCFIMLFVYRYSNLWFIVNPAPHRPDLKYCWWNLFFFYFFSLLSTQTCYWNDQKFEESSSWNESCVLPYSFVFYASGSTDITKTLGVTYLNLKWRSSSHKSDGSTTT